MTAQEIMAAIDRLPILERDRLLDLVSSYITTQYQPEDSIHAIDRHGNSHDYPIEDLIWNPDSYGYIKAQERLFEIALPELSQRYAGEYIVFENGSVIDRDRDEDALLDRVCKTDFYQQRSAIYYKLVPEIDKTSREKALFPSRD
jgi:hypothetical protein